MGVKAVRNSNLRDAEVLRGKQTSRRIPAGFKQLGKKKSFLTIQEKGANSLDL